MRRPEAVQTLAIEAKEETNAQQGQQHRPPPGELARADQGLLHRRQCASLVNRSGPKARFGHPEQQEAGQQERGCPAEKDRPCRLRQADPHTQRHGYQPAQVAGLRPAQKGLLRALGADLIGNPGLRRAAGKGVAEAPDELRQKDCAKEGQCSLEDQA